eukprot:CAMPEP_0195297368 /NCGR_PEP_ID=MMETSP0707-20130614/21363_1 /TAXON_ID=33640 /ORGANISM="Asterionellopsis glacialis, Strain CCMP134" /LENGTH=425 /DNA_ID=CAMNT_0040359159 /DNA_START=56 /DNA_END=1333 /DNA_ORIENTATION=-
MIKPSLCALLTLGVAVHAWIPTTPTFQTRSGATHRAVTTMSAVPDLKGKVIYQRLLHRLSPKSDVVVHNNFSVEERVCFKPDEEDEGYLTPHGRRTLILRGAPVSDTDVGPELFRLDVHERSIPTGVGSDSAMECSICMALYLSSNPDVLVGNVLELQTDLGLGGLVGSIAAGFAEQVVQGQTEGSVSDNAATPATNGDSHVAVDDMMPHKHSVPLPESLEKLTLSGGDDELMNLAFANVKISGIPSEKIEMREFDWRHQRPERLAKQRYHVVLGSDIAFSYPTCRELSRAVAYSLEPLPWEDISAARFIHLCPEHRDDVTYLKKFLEQGYRMNLNHGYVKLQKIFLKPVILDAGDPESKVDEEPLEVQTMKESTYQSLLAMHSPDYTGDNGDFFFPVENGAFSMGSSSSSSTNLEQEPSSPWLQ